MLRRRFLSEGAPPPSPGRSLCSQADLEACARLDVRRDTVLRLFGVQTLLKRAADEADGADKYIWGSACIFHACAKSSYPSPPACFDFSLRSFKSQSLGLRVPCILRASLACTRTCAGMCVCAREVLCVCARARAPVFACMFVCQSQWSV